MRINNLNNEFVQFTLVGGLAALANIGSRIGLSTIFNYVTAIIIAYGIGMATAFLLCKWFIFTEAKTSTPQQVILFSLVNLLAVGQTVLVSLFLYNYAFTWIDDLSYRELLAHLIGVCVPIFTSYFGHKHITFNAN